jgi:phenylacetate-CoA ligase
VDYYDELETRSEAERHAELISALQKQVGHARALAPAYARILADVEPESIVDLAALAWIPVTRKSRLLALQRDLPPFGGLAAMPLSDVARVFQSPGPLYEPEGRQPDYWRFSRALFAAGVRRGDLVHNAFSYHFTPAGSMLDSAASALGCPVFPAGVGQTELQVRAMVDLQPKVYAGTPSFLGILIDKADELSLDVSSLKRALVSGEGVPPGLQERMHERGIELFQAYGSADLGLIAYESEAREGLICDEGVYVEIVRPGTDQSVPDGEVGEVVVTGLNPVYPLIRFGTGDLSAVLPGNSPCGRSNRRIRGWLGRADQSTKVRGLFVHPEQVAAVLARHPVLKRARLEVSRDADQDQMILRCEVEAVEEGLAERIAGSLRDICKLRGEVELQPPGTLPNDGKVVDDQRSYE